MSPLRSSLSRADPADGLQATAALLQEFCDKRVPAGYSIGINPENDGRRFHVSPGGVVVVADITSAKHLGRSVDPYALEMAPMGWSPVNG